MAADRNQPSGVRRPTLRLLDVEGAGRGLRWRFELEGQSLACPVSLTVLSSREGLVHDTQQLGAMWSEVDLPQGTAQLITERIREEVARAKLADVLSNRGRRAA